MPMPGLACCIIIYATIFCTIFQISEAITGSCPADAETSGYCNKGACVNETGEHYCNCDNSYIGTYCNETWTINVAVSSAVPQLGEEVVFTVTSNRIAQVNLTTPSKDIHKLSSSDTDQPFEYKHILSSVLYSDIGQYEFDAYLTFEETDYFRSLAESIRHVLTVTISTPTPKVYYQEGKSNAQLTVEVKTPNADVTSITVHVTKGSLDEKLTKHSADETSGISTFVYEFPIAITAEDAGNYNFVATETFEVFTRVESIDVNLEVEVVAKEPTISESGTFIVTRGSETTITCKPNGGNPTPAVFWQFNDNNITFDSESGSASIYQTSGGSLVFSVNVPFDSGGIYTCVAQNFHRSIREETNASKSVTITIEGAPEFVSSTSDSNLQKESLSFTCEFNALPAASIKWKFDETDVSEIDQFPMSKQETNLKEYKKTSELSITHSALCLGVGTIACVASNRFNEEKKEFNINPDPYEIYEDSYIIFPSQPKTFSEAENYCSSLEGKLVDILSKEDDQRITTKADEIKITEFFIGLRYGDTDWKWTDDSVLGEYVNWESNTEPSSGCAVSFKNGSDWKWESKNCDTSTNFACIVKASKSPSSVTAIPNNCDGTKASVSWTPDNFFNQSIRIIQDSIVDNLDKSSSSKDFDSLTHNTFYTIQVSSGVGVCKKLPYAETSFTSAFGKSLPPTATITDKICNVTWTYPVGRKGEVTSFTIVTTEKENTVNSDVLVVYNDSTIGYSYSVSQPKPNSIYKIKIRTISCIGNSDIEEVSCTTDVASPDPTTINLVTSQTPSETDITQGIPFQIKKIQERSGRIECLYIVGRYRTDGDEFANFQITAEMFNELAEYSESLGPNQDYIAFAVTNSDRNITIGKGGQSSCPVAQGRKKRETVPNQPKSGNNGPLKNGNYQFYVITATQDGSNLLISNGPWTKSVQVNPAPINPVVIVLPIVLIIFIIIIIVLAVLLWKRRKKTKSVHRPPPPPPPNAVPQSRHAHINAAFSENVYENASKDTSIAVENLRSTYQSKHADEDRLFREEYRALATEVSELNIHYSYAMAVEVRDKNRFSNIHPANESRVVLRREGTDIYSDYINASYIDGYRQPRKFIAAQGPLPNTMSDFWYMIWEQESTVIVMLTRVNENGRRKCEKYWPDHREQTTFDNLIVSSINVSEYGQIIKRSFQLWNPNQPGKKLLVEQFHYITWPDHGVPITTSDLFNLRRMVIESQGNNPSPIIVHCSAGVGRTGTFIALDYLSHQMERESKVDIYGVVFNMRKKRREMVQTVEQYGLLHKLMLEKHLLGITDLKTAEFGNTHGSHYESVDIEDGFYNLSIIPPFTSDTHIPDDAHSKIRDKDVVPYGHSKVIIRMRPSEEKGRFINASYVKTYDANDSMIACQGPVKSNIEDFWRVVLDNNVSCIVMLSKLEEGGEEHCSQYWPTDCENPCSFGDVTISMQSETKEGEFTERWIQVSEKVLHLRRSLSVMQLQYDKWPTNSVPVSGADILSMIAKSQTSKKIMSGGKTTPILVHCRDGSSRTGTFCAVANLIERLKNEDRIDVFRTVKDLRDMRPLMVRTLEQYRFCFRTVQEYLDSFQLYANFK